MARLPRRAAIDRAFAAGRSWSGRCSAPHAAGHRSRAGPRQGPSHHRPCPRPGGDAMANGFAFCPRHGLRGGGFGRPIGLWDHARDRRFSIGARPMKQSFASRPSALRQRRLSGSVVLICVSFARFCWCRFAPSPEPSFGLKLFCDARASSVPSPKNARPTRAASLGCGSGAAS